MAERIKTGGATFDPDAGPIVFVAANVESLEVAHTVNSSILVSVAEWTRATDGLVDGWLGAGCDVFIDSGIFTLTMQHARAHGVSMDRALALAPSEIDGFGELRAEYMRIVGKFGARAWGYVELDQGGRENKIETRAGLEGEGLRPVPVYHPLNDGWEYFDYLAERYDRICLGNIVGASTADRAAIIYTVAERRKAHPGLRWIHGLGLGIHPLMVSPALNSADASSWLAAVRWHGAAKEYGFSTSVDAVRDDLTYDMLADAHSDKGHKKARRLSAYQYAMLGHNLRALTAERQELGL